MNCKYSLCPIININYFWDKGQIYRIPYVIWKPKNNHLYYYVHVSVMRQAIIRKSLGLIEKSCISDWPCFGPGTTHAPPRHPPSPPPPRIDYWWESPGSFLLKAPGEEKRPLHLQIPPVATKLPFVFPFLTFNKPHLYHVSHHGLFPVGHKEFGNLIAGSTLPTTVRSRELHFWCPFCPLTCCSFMFALYDIVTIITTSPRSCIK
jgi:hypothetical protein